MQLTSPLGPTDIQTAYPRDTRGMDASAGGELEVLLETEERALRALYRVSATDAETDEALAAAMKFAWPSFLQQARQVASEDVGVSDYRVVFNRAGVIDFAFPAAVAAMLAPYADREEHAGVKGESRAAPISFSW